MLIITCSPGFEQICKKELQRLGYKAQIEMTSILSCEEKSEKDIAYLNTRLRTANKVMLVVDTAVINNFDDLFEFVYQQERPEIIASWQKIDIALRTHQSHFKHVPSMQSLTQKAIYKKLLWTTDKQWEIDEKLGSIAVEIIILGRQCIITLNSSGDSLHRRGYRKTTGDAPLKETIAAGLILLSGWRFHQTFIDPCCWSGTLAIEAALIAKNIAPGLDRKFAFEERTWYDDYHLIDVQQEAVDKQMHKDYHIIASDIDPAMIEVAKTNAKHAGINDYIIWKTQDIDKFLLDNFPNKSSIVTNPPYGKRLQTQDLERLYRTLFDLYSNELISGGFISGYERVAEICPNTHQRTQKRLKNWPDDVIFWKKKV